MSRYYLPEKYSAKAEDAKKVFENCNKISHKFPSEGMWNFVYGFDHACGYFYQFYPVVEDEEEYIMEADSIFDGMSGLELAYVLKLVGCKNQRHIDLASEDWEF